MKKSSAIIANELLNQHNLTLHIRDSINELVEKLRKAEERLGEMAVKCKAETGFSLDDCIRYRAVVKESVKPGHKHYIISSHDGQPVYFIGSEIVSKEDYDAYT